MQTKLIRIALVVAAVLALTACRKGTSGDTSAASAADTDALTGIVELAVGTLRLDDTDQALDAATAAQLLPLWKAYRALLTSDTTVPTELEALEEQIRETMTAAQVNAITTMELTAEDLTAVLQKHGGLGGGAADGADADQRRDLRAAAGEQGGVRSKAGGFSGGAPPQGGAEGGPMGDAAGMDPSAIETLRAEGGAGTTTQANRMLVPLVQAVIITLEGKL